MASLHVNLTAGHNASMAHIPGTLDPQMRVFYQRNLDPFDSSLSMTDLFRVAGNFLGVARSSLSWARQFFAPPPFPQPGQKQSEKGKEAGEEEERPPKPKAEKGADPEPEPASPEAAKTPQPPANESPAEESVRRTREASRSATAEARERFRQARKEKSAEKPATFAELPQHYGLRLALELSLEQGRKPKRAREEAAPPQGASTVDGVPGRALPGLSFQGSLSLHLPLGRTRAAEGRSREGR